MFFLLFFSTTKISSFLASIQWSHCIVISHKTFTDSLSSTPSGWCSNHLSTLLRSCFPQSIQYKILAMSLCLLLHSFCANIYIHILDERLIHLHKGLFFVLPMLYLTAFFFKACSCATKISTSVSTFWSLSSSIPVLFLYQRYPAFQKQTAHTSSPYSIWQHIHVDSSFWMEAFPLAIHR